MDPIPPQLSKNNPLATWSLTLSIFGLLLSPCCPPLMLFLCVPAVICGHKARGRIQRAMTAEGSGTSVAGLVIGYIGIAVTILALPIYLAIALPAFAKARAKATEARDASIAMVCQSNLQQLQAAKDQYMLEHQGALPKSIDELVGPSLPATAAKCPGTGTYSLGGMNGEVSCSAHSTKAEKLKIPGAPEVEGALELEPAPREK